MGKFAPVGPAAPSAVTVSAKTTPTIRSVILGLAGIETTLTFGSAVVSFELQATDNSKLTIATTSGNTSGNDAWSIYHGNTYSEEFLTTSTGKTFYLASNKVGTVVQIKEWI